MVLSLFFHSFNSSVNTFPPLTVLANNFAFISHQHALSSSLPSQTLQWFHSVQHSSPNISTQWLSSLALATNVYCLLQMQQHNAIGNTAPTETLTSERACHRTKVNSNEPSLKCWRRTSVYVGIRLVRTGSDWPTLPDTTSFDIPWQCDPPTLCLTVHSTFGLTWLAVTVPEPLCLTTDMTDSTRRAWLCVTGLHVLTWHNDPHDFDCMTRYSVSG